MENFSSKNKGASFFMLSLYATPQRDRGHNTLETQNEIWVPNDEAWNNLPNAFYRIRLS